MKKSSKRHAENISKVEASKIFKLSEAISFAQDAKRAKFVESVDIHMKLGVDPKKADQAVRGTVSLPHGTGKKISVLVFATGTEAEAARAAGADFVGMEDLIEKIQGGWTGFDIAIATPPSMREVGKLGKFLGPRGLMPTPKAGTVTADVATAVAEFKAGKVEFRVDRQGGINNSIGKVNFSADKLLENLHAFISAILRAKPAACKGTYIKSMAISTTMGPGFRLDVNEAERESVKK